MQCRNSWAKLHCALGEEERNCLRIAWLAAGCSYGPWVTWTYWGYRELVEPFAFFIPASVLKKNQVQQAWLNAGLKPVAFISVV